MYHAEGAAENGNADDDHEEAGEGFVNQHLGEGALVWVIKEYFYDISQLELGWQDEE
jgi:hypothetical protein